MELSAKRKKIKNVLGFIRPLIYSFEKEKKNLVSQSTYPLLSCGVLSRNYEGRVSVVGMIYALYKSKKGHIVIDIEDMSGKVRALIASSHPLFSKVLQLKKDTSVLVEGSYRREILFVDRILMNKDGQ